jgi:hypothetical protein
MSYYTFDDYRDMLFSGVCVKLNDTTEEKINILTNEVNRYVKTLPVLEDNYKKRYKRNHKGFGQPSSPSSQSNFKYNTQVSPTATANVMNVYSESEWTKEIVFNKRIETKKEGPNNTYTELKLAFNKLTLNNYDTIMNTIKGLVEQLIDNEQSDDEEREETGSPYDKIFTIFSNIICQTKNSDVYVKSFKELIGKYPTFVSNLDGFINEYYTSYENMVDVNPSADYEKYCILTKNNEQRRNKSGFIMGLYNDNLLKVDELVELLKWCLTRVLQGVNEEGNTLLVEELSENIYIIVNSLVNKKEFIEDEEKRWDEVKEMIYTCAKLKANDTKSLSSRIIFKYMDVVDILSKK